MNESKEINMEAISLDLAHELIEEKTPAGFYCYSQEILSDGIPKIYRSVGTTTTDAFDKAEKGIPATAEVIDRKEKTPPGETSLAIEAFTDIEAQACAENQISADARVSHVKLSTKGSDGFLGLGRRPNQYVATIVQSAIVEVSYREPARIKARVRPIPTVADVHHCLIALEKKTGEQWLQLDKPLPNAMAALMLMGPAFEYLENLVASPFNEILSDTRKIFESNSAIQSICYLSLGAPNRDYGIDDISMISTQFRQAIQTMRRLKEIISALDMNE